MRKTYKFCCAKCVNCAVVNKKYFSVVFGVIEDNYCKNAEKVEFENHSKCETEIYCKNYKEKKDESGR